MKAQGFVEPAFAALPEAFEHNFRDHGEIGAACCVYRNGRPVADLWGGVADPESGRQRDERTLQLVFSAAKGPTSVCIHRLVEADVLDLDAPIAGGSVACASILPVIRAALPW